jgi:transcription antitermination factor NusG
MINSVQTCFTYDCPIDLKWYAVYTIAKHEKSVVTHLAHRNIAAFTPTLRQMHNWSDRNKFIDVPLFSCYVFIQAPEWREVHRVVRTVPGVLEWVGRKGEPVAIPNDEISVIRTITEEQLRASSHPFLKAGQRVRVRGGCLDGVEGILVEDGKDNRLVVSVNLIQQAASVSLQGYQIVPIP